MCPDVLPASLLSRDGRYTYLVFNTIPILLRSVSMVAIMIYDIDTDT